jgi:hypothetical protein
LPARCWQYSAAASDNIFCMTNNIFSVAEKAVGEAPKVFLAPATNKLKSTTPMAVYYVFAH